MADPDRYCQDKAAASGSSFYYSFLFLPPEERHALTAFYALCRELDDIVDDCRDPQVARLKLAWWNEEIDRLYAGAPRHPVGQALAPVLRASAIDRAQLQEILDGMAMDLERSGYADFKALQLYCHRVAGVVGQIAAQILGYRQRATHKYAHDLGVALQLTNIIRDVGEDARRGRIYLPRDELAQFGVAPAQILRAQPSPAFRALMEHQWRRAEDYYARAFAALPRADRKSQRAGLAMGAIYRALLREMRRDGFQVLDRRYALTPLRKFWLTARIYLLGRMP